MRGKKKGGRSINVVRGKKKGRGRSINVLRGKERVGGIFFGKGVGVDKIYLMSGLERGVKVISGEKRGRRR